jgi:hypothetical protein
MNAWIVPHKLMRGPVPDTRARTGVLALAGRGGQRTHGAGGTGWPARRRRDRCVVAAQPRRAERSARAHGPPDVVRCADWPGDGQRAGRLRRWLMASATTARLSSDPSVPPTTGTTDTSAPGFTADQEPSALRQRSIQAGTGGLLSKAALKSTSLTAVLGSLRLGSWRLGWLFGVGCTSSMQREAVARPAERAFDRRTSNGGNWERSARSVLTVGRRQLHFITGRSECRVLVRHRVP